MKFWIVVSLLAHTALGWLLYDRMMMPPKVPRDTSLMVNLVQIAPPPPPRVQPAKQPEAPKPEKAESVKAEPPKPKPKKPEPVVSKKTASPLEKLLAKIKKQKKKRDRDESREKPTPTPRSLAQSVPTIKPLAVPTVQVAQADSRQQDNQRSPVAIDIPQGLYKYNYYFSAIGNTLRRNWTVPQLPRIERYLAVVELTLLRDGRVLQYRFVQKSGDRTFDLSVEEAIRLSKFPPFADDYDKNAMTVTVRFRPEG